MTLNNPTMVAVLFRHLLMSSPSPQLRLLLHPPLSSPMTSLLLELKMSAVWPQILVLLLLLRLLPQLPLEFKPHPQVKSPRSLRSNLPLEVKATPSLPRLLRPQTSLRMRT